MHSNPSAQIRVCLQLSTAISGTRSVEEIYGIALDALADGLGLSRASILLFDPDGVMRFKAYRGLSESYRQAVEGHTPWTPDSPAPEPIVVADVRQDASLAPYLPLIVAEGIAAMAFIPLINANRVIGKFMLYYDQPQSPGEDDMQLAVLIASHVAFAVARTRAEEQARRGQERLRFALDAALMGTWDWDFATNTVQWSENLERIHGLPPGTFDGSFSSYEREIHPDDRERVLASVQRAIAEGVIHEVEYRIVGPDGTIRWCEGKGRVEYQDGIPKSMSGVCMMVTRRKHAELARLAAAEETSRLKDDFLATLSHELRTPLNAILGWTQLLQSGALPAARVQPAIDIIERNARLQAQIIEDILDVSRIITGKLAIEHVPVSVRQLMDAVLSGAFPSAEAKGIRIETAIPGAIPPLLGDPKRLHQVVANVISNAIKFSPEGGRVVIDCVPAGEAVEIRVRDFGVGIDAEFLPYMFDRFRQADSRSTRKHGGLGLGLAIARNLLELHGGEIRAESGGLGQGTTIIMTVPAAAAMPTAGTPPAREALPGHLALDMNGSTIVVVDDQRDSRELLAALFEGHGARVVQCETAEAAIAALEDAPAELLVADIAMPNVDGHELIRRVRQTHGSLAAVAISAYARPEDRDAALASGYNGYCAKPIDAGQVLDTVRQLCFVR